jgi:hypothetical protein
MTRCFREGDLGDFPEISRGFPRVNRVVEDAVGIDDFPSPIPSPEKLPNRPRLAEGDELLVLDLLEVNDP